MRQGEGKFSYVNGTVYEGEFKNNKANGYGFMTWLYGKRYEGEFKDDKIHG